jgi:hypothetical protein
MLAKVANFREDVRPEVQAASDYSHFCSTPINGHRQTGPVGLVRAMSRH